MNRTVSAAPNNASLSTQPCLANHLCAVTSVSISPCEMAESIAAEESFYHTLCEGEGSIGKTYNAPLSDEQRIYKEFEGKRFQKLYHEELV